MKQKTATGGRRGFISISLKISIVVLATLVLVTALCVFITVRQNNSFADGLIEERIERAFLNLTTSVAKLDQDCERAMETLKKNSVFMTAVKSQNAQSVASVPPELSEIGLDALAVTDADGNIIFTLGTEDASPYVKAALAAGDGRGLYGDGAREVFAAASFTVMGDGGQPAGHVVGVISYRNEALLDELKAIHGSDFTIFAGNVRMATTIVQNGERVVGTELDAAVADIVINQKQEYRGSTHILNAPYKTAYAPILGSDGSAVGVMFAGLPMSEIEADRTSAVVNSVLFGVALIIIGNVGMLLYIKRSVRLPLNTLTEGAGKLAAGDTDLSFKRKSRDEIGVLAGAFERAAGAVKAMLADASALSQAAVEGRLSVRADAEKHEGDYRKIIEGVNKTLDAVVVPVQEASAVLGEMARGNLSARVEGDYRGDHAIIKESFNATLKEVSGYIDEIAAALGEMAKGNFNVNITGEYLGDFVALKNSINHIATSLSGVLTNISVAADQVAAGTSQVSAGSQAISQGATEQAASIEELTASIAEIAAQTRRNAQNANKANALSENARAGAQQGNAQMRELQQAMRDINDASESISKIIKVIDDIAFQTNILALNAAVEAARAGIHGKGFGVVAEEVRNLASKSKDAASETAALIEGSVKKAAAGQKIADDTAVTLANIVEGAENSHRIVGEIAVASNEQANGIAQVNRGIEQMSQVVQTNSATAEEAAAAAEELSGQADLLKSMVGQFTVRPGGRR